MFRFSYFTEKSDYDDKPDTEGIRSFNLETDDGLSVNEMLVLFERFLYMCGYGDIELSFTYRGLDNKGDDDKVDQEVLL